MNELIRDWISKGKPYEMGVNIYCQLGDNEAIKQILKKGRSSFFINKLDAAMMELLRQGETKVNTKVEKQLLPDQEAKQDFKELKKYNRTDISHLPNEVGAIIKLKGQCYKDAATLHATVLKGKDKEKRRLAAFEILRLMQINQSCWNKLNYYDKYGSLPIDEVKGEDFANLSPGDKEMMIQRNRVYLSRHKWINDADAAENPRYEYFAAECRRRTKELEELEKPV
jgi:hypothetical protein